MTSDMLKTRAKQLRPAVAEMFKVKVTHSQALELVAKEENFPSWDAACAAYGRPSRTPAIGRLLPTEKSIKVKIRRDQVPTMATIFEECAAIPREMHRLLDLSDSRGALVLISGRTMQGKSTTAKVVMGDTLLAKHSTHKPTMMIDAEACLDLPLDQRLVLVDEVRTARMAFEVVALARAGVKVVATIHGQPGMHRLRMLLRQFGVGEVFLDGLIDEGQILSIDQELVWPDEFMRLQASRERHEMMLRQHGFEGSEARALVEKGPKAVRDALNLAMIPHSTLGQGAGRAELTK